MDEIDNNLKELYSGDLGNGFSKFVPQEQIALNEFYNSERFIVGYRELQNKLAQPTYYANINKPKYDGMKKRQSLCLPLKDVNKPETSCFSTASNNSSNYSSCSGTPNSEIDSPNRSCFDPSASNLCFTSNFINCGSSRTENDFNRNTLPRELSFNKSKKYKTSVNKIISFFGSIKNVFQGSDSPNNANFKRRMSSSLNQLQELQEEMETYKKLSESKKQAAELLKHQLMEALYKRVVVEWEKKDEKKKLEMELQKVEWQLKVLQSTTESSQRNWGCRFDSVMKERDQLLELLKTSPTGLHHTESPLQTCFQDSIKDYRRCSI